jgi:hypothetical protein
MAAPDVRACALEDPKLFEEFQKVEGLAYAGDPWFDRLPGAKADPRAQLSPGAPFVLGGGERRAFVALVGGAPAARVVALRSPRLVEADASGAQAPVGLVGWYDAVPGEAGASASKAVLDAACAWLAARGAKRVVGPMNGSTWFRYRLVTSGFERGPFLLEPYNPARYPAFFAAAGFAPARPYATLRIPLTPVKLLEGSHRRCVAAGVTFEPLDLARAQASLRTFYDLSCRVFAGKTAYSAISWPEFQALYQGAGSILEPGLSLMARDRGGDPIGFLFAYPDLLEPARKGGGRPTTTVLKTIGALPDGPRGLGWAMTHLHMEAARAAGYTHSLFALMEKYEELLRFANHGARMLEGETGSVWKEYALFARPL